ncbi:proteasomal ubiquitin receptor ADRM1-like [Argonauta hians]
MATGPLFGSSTARSQNKNLVEFRAGRMTLKDKMVYPDKRKGLIYIYQSDDSLMHFCWKDRSHGQVEDDLIIFPDDIEFKRIPQCTSGRVYVLKFKSSVRRFFFWMQEPKTEKDDEYCRKVNEYLNNPPSPTSSRNSGPDHSGLEGADLQNILGNMSQQQLMQLFGGIGMSSSFNFSSLLGRNSSMESDSASSSTTTSRPASGHTAAGTTAAATAGTTTEAVSSSSSATTVSTAGAGAASATTTSASTTLGSSASATVTVGAAAAAAGAAATTTTTTTSTKSSTSSPSDTPRQQIQLSDLQSILSNMHVPVDKAQDNIELYQVLKPDDIIPILANSEIQQHLLQYLPEGEILPRTEKELRNTVQSPQFQQALQSFSAALRSRELGPLMTQFGLGDDVATAAAEGDLEAFVKALQEAQKKKDENK